MHPHSLEILEVDSSIFARFIAHLFRSFQISLHRKYSISTAMSGSTLVNQLLIYHCLLALVLIDACVASPLQSQSRLAMADLSSIGQCHSLTTAVSALSTRQILQTADPYMTTTRYQATLTARARKESYPRKRDMSSSEGQWVHALFSENHSHAIEACCSELVCQNSENIICYSKLGSEKLFKECAESKNYSNVLVTNHQSSLGSPEDECCLIDKAMCPTLITARRVNPSIGQRNPHQTLVARSLGVWFDVNSTSSDLTPIKLCCDRTGHKICGSDKRFLCRIQLGAEHLVQQFQTCVKNSVPEASLVQHSDGTDPSEEATCCAMGSKFCPLPPIKPSEPVQPSSLVDDKPVPSLLPGAVEPKEASQKSKPYVAEFRFFKPANKKYIEECCKGDDSTTACATSEYVICTFPSREKALTAYRCSRDADQDIKLVQQADNMVTAEFLCKSRTDLWLDDGRGANSGVDVKHDKWYEIISTSPSSLQRLKKCCEKFGRFFCEGASWLICDTNSAMMSLDGHSPDLLVCARSQDPNMMANEKVDSTGTPESNCCTRNKEHCIEELPPTLATSTVKTTDDTFEDAHIVPPVHNPSSVSQLPHVLPLPSNLQQTEDEPVLKDGREAWAEFTFSDSQDCKNVEKCCESNNGRVACSDQLYVICSFSNMNVLLDAFKCSIDKSPSVQMMERDPGNQPFTAEAVCKARTTEWLDKLPPPDSNPDLEYDTWYKISNFKDYNSKAIEKCCERLGRWKCSNDKHIICDAPSSKSGLLHKCVTMRDSSASATAFIRSQLTSSEIECCAMNTEYCPKPIPINTQSSPENIPDEQTAKEITQDEKANDPIVLGSAAIPPEIGVPRKVEEPQIIVPDEQIVKEILQDRKANDTIASGGAAVPPEIGAKAEESQVIIPGNQTAKEIIPDKNANNTKFHSSVAVVPQTAMSSKSKDPQTAEAIIQVKKWKDTRVQNGAAVLPVNVVAVKAVNSEIATIKIHSLDNITLAGPQRVTNANFTSLFRKLDPYLVSANNTSSDPRYVDISRLHRPESNSSSSRHALANQISSTDKSLIASPHAATSQIVANKMSSNGPASVPAQPKLDDLHVYVCGGVSDGRGGIKFPNVTTLQHVTAHSKTDKTTPFSISQDPLAEGVLSLSPEVSTESSPSTTLPGTNDRQVDLSDPNRIIRVGDPGSKENAFADLGTLNSLGRNLVPNECELPAATYASSKEHFFLPPPLMTRLTRNYTTDLILEFSALGSSEFTQCLKCALCRGPQQENTGDSFVCSAYSANGEASSYGASPTPEAKNAQKLTTLINAHAGSKQTTHEQSPSVLPSDDTKSLTVSIEPGDCPISSAMHETPENESSSSTKIPACLIMRIKDAVSSITTESLTYLDKDQEENATNAKVSLSCQAKTFEISLSMAKKSREAPPKSPKDSGNKSATQIHGVLESPIVVQDTKLETSAAIPTYSGNPVPSIEAGVLLNYTGPGGAPYQCPSPTGQGLLTNESYFGPKKPAQDSSTSGASRCEPTLIRTGVKILRLLQGLVAK